MKYFKLCTNNDNIECVPVNKCYSFTIHNINFFASKDKFGWNITEISTGFQCSFKKYKTKDEAIKGVEEFISEVGIDKVRTVIKAAYECYKAEIDRYTRRVSPKVTNMVVEI